LPYYETDVAPGTTYDVSDHSRGTYVGSEVPYDLGGAGGVATHHFRFLRHTIDDYATGRHPNDIELDMYFSDELGLVHVEGLVFTGRDGEFFPYFQVSWRLLKFVSNDS
jgi:hypothetical protein